MSIETDIELNQCTEIPRLLSDLTELEPSQVQAPGKATSIGQNVSKTNNNMRGKKSSARNLATRLLRMEQKNQNKRLKRKKENFNK